MYELILTQDAAKLYDQADGPLVKRLNRCFDQLVEDPFGNPNTKRLHGDLAGCYRYRIGDWRVIYRIEQERSVIIIMIVHRSAAYKG